MTGMVMVVTGASSGIGHEVARLLAEGGNDVTLACRDEDEGMDAVRRIKVALPNALVQFLQVDLSSTSSVRTFVKEFMHRRRRLDVLINNAGMALNPRDLTRKLTTDGFELTMATNYFGPFLLTQLLLEYMIQTANITGETRIINISCASHQSHYGFPYADLDVLRTSNLQLQKSDTYNGRQAYKNSKLCNILFTYSLAARLRGTRVRVNAVDPGIVATTRLSRHADTLERTLASCCLHGVLRPLLQSRKTVHGAAMHVVNVATSQRYEGRSGKFFRDGVEERSSIESYDPDRQKVVWRQTCQLLGIHQGPVDTDAADDDVSLGSMNDGLK